MCSKIYNLFKDLNGRFMIVSEKGIAENLQMKIFWVHTFFRVYPYSNPRLFFGKFQTIYNIQTDKRPPFLHYTYKAYLYSWLWRSVTLSWVELQWKNEVILPFHFLFFLTEIYPRIWITSKKIEKTSLNLILNHDGCKNYSFSVNMQISWLVL